MSDNVSAKLERLIDERLAVAVDKSVGGYMCMLDVWQDSLESTQQWMEDASDDFTTFADTIALQYAHRLKQQMDLNQSLGDHTYPVPHSGTFAPHWCSRECWWQKDVTDWVQYSPLELPIRLGWQRIVMQRTTDVRDVFYAAPCGRRLRSMEEVQRFLEATDVINVDISSFTFDPTCAVVHGTYNPRQSRFYFFKVDITEGMEAVPISCINTVDTATPEAFQYTNTRVAEPDVRIPEDIGFLVSCDCEDGCSSEACPCRQLTAQEARGIGDGLDSVGYLHHRLRRPQLSGIYECNAGCSCGPQCPNRVVQSGIKHRLQVFRTAEKGWGLRTLDDIPRGAFVCTYIGRIYTEQGGDEMAVHYGDEYFAELDYIEVMERHKEGYESDVEPDPHSSSSSSSTSPTLSANGSTYSIESMGQMKVRIRKVASLGEEEDQFSSSLSDEDEYLNVDDTPPSPHSLELSASFLPLSAMNKSASLQPRQQQQQQQPPHTFSPLKGQASRTRRFYHEDYSYLMDAKCCGNIGRYINHSCLPNMVVQNVFIDTHDLRFPWVAFFAKKHIRAMHELTWDYNYEVGSVVGKNIKCLCGATKCRGRLL